MYSLKIKVTEIPIHGANYILDRFGYLVTVIGNFSL